MRSAGIKQAITGTTNETVVMKIRAGSFVAMNIPTAAMTVQMPTIQPERSEVKMRPARWQTLSPAATPFPRPFPPARRWLRRSVALGHRSGDFRAFGGKGVDTRIGLGSSPQGNKSGVFGPGQVSGQSFVEAHLCSPYGSAGSGVDRSISRANTALQNPDSVAPFISARRCKAARWGAETLTRMSLPYFCMTAL